MTGRRRRIHAVCLAIQDATGQIVTDGHNPYQRLAAAAGGPGVNVSGERTFEAPRAQSGRCSTTRRRWRGRARRPNFFDVHDRHWTANVNPLGLGG
jgi:hypothetical protein